MNINRVTIVGFAGKDAKTSATQGGKPMTKLSIATTKRYKDAAGVWQEKTQWHECVAYGSTGDYAARILRGAHVMIEGELAHREYERTIETDNGPVKVPWQ
jgi:single-strand DNA-binding protein